MFYEQREFIQYFEFEREFNSSQRYVLFIIIYCLCISII